MDFKNKVVWITGASSGIGEALTKAFAAQGAKLAISARRESELNRVQKEAKLKDDDCLVLPFDVEDYRSAPKKMQAIIKKFGRIDILMNNAGVSTRGKAIDNDIEVYERILQLNTLSVIAITKAVLPYMLAQKSGIITVTSSVAGRVGTPMRTAYCASKHAVHGFFDALRAEVHDEGLQVTILCPGYIKTDISVNALAADGAKYNKMDQNQLNGLSPEDCAAKMLKAIAKGKREVLIGGKETYGVYLKRFFPGILAKIVRKVNTKTV